MKHYLPLLMAMTSFCLVAPLVANDQFNQGMQQGNDRGTQYRSAIYPLTPEQSEAANRPARSIRPNLSPLIPAKAGIQSRGESRARRTWVPAFAWTSGEGSQLLDGRRIIPGDRASRPRWTGRGRSARPASRAPGGAARSAGRSPASPAPSRRCPPTCRRRRR